MTLYFANFENSDRCGIVFWGSSSKTVNVFIIQKRVLRIMYNKMSSLQPCGIYLFEVIMFTFRKKDTLLEDSTNLSYPKHRTLYEKNPQYMERRMFNKLGDKI